MNITKKVIDKIKKTIGKKINESGGIVGTTGNDINHYIYDRECDNEEYIPNIIFLNNVLSQWNQEGVSFVGIIHSHKMNNNLSYADIEYAKRIVEINHLEYIYMLIFVLNKEMLYAYRVGYGNEDSNNTICVWEEKLNVRSK